MRVFGVTGSHSPGSASQIGILGVSLQGSVPGVFPQSLQPIEGDLLNGTVVGIGRAGTAIPDDRSRVRRIRRVRKEVSPVIICSVVNRERLLLGRSPFETSGPRSGMDHREAGVSPGSVGANYQFRPCGCQVVSAAVTPKNVGQEHELVAQQIVVGCDLTSAA